MRLYVCDECKREQNEKMKICLEGPIEDIYLKGAGGLLLPGANVRVFHFCGKDCFRAWLDRNVFSHQTHGL
jgi:hypothetical protein